MTDRNVAAWRSVAPIPPPLWGWYGRSDPVLTCTDNQSRNRRFTMLGRGMDVKGAQDKIGQVVEGHRNGLLGS